MTTLQELKELDIKGKNVMLVGSPASGKSFIAKEISDGSHILIHSDSFIDYGYEQSMYEFLEATQNLGGVNYIGEGVAGYRALRKMVQNGIPLPDIIIHVTRSEHELYKTYRSERDLKKFALAMAAHKGNLKVWNGFLDSLTEEQVLSGIPMLINLENNF